jgi:deoxyribonuclease V
MEIVRPAFVPDPDDDRETMESVQRAVADAATFADDHAVDPTALPGGAFDDRAPVVAGIDQAFLDDQAVSAVVARRGGETVERVGAVEPLSIPYVPGLLSFREGGPILAAVQKLSVEPDLLLFDGSGRIHFREAGLATHLGVVLDCPSVGVAKSLLCGTPDDDLEDLPAGERVPIRADGDVSAPDGTLIGHAVQTRQYDSPSRSINPLYVSPGHHVSAATAATVAARCATEYKLPEPTRLADNYAAELKREHGDG